MNSYREFVSLLVLFLAWPGAAVDKAPAALAKWEPEISAFEKADRTNPPPKNALLFVGSSSIRLWKSLGADFTGTPVINRGFGGSEISDSTAFADRIIIPYRPAHILLYAGDNDIANGKSPEQLLADFKQFVAVVRAKLPETPITFISIKPSPSRWHLVEKVKGANRLISEYISQGQRLSYIDVFSKMLDAAGKPRAELFISDQLHMNAKGYAIWTELIKAHLAQQGDWSKR